MQDNNYFPVNWVDGMKINRGHFMEQEKAFVYQTARGVGSLLNPLNYGLLPAARDERLKLFVSVDQQQRVQVRVQHCRAVTAGGYYIEFGEDSVLGAPVPLGHLQQRAGVWYAVLTINPYKRVPYGPANPAESPVRLPYTLPLYTVDLLAEGELAKNTIGDFQLVVGRLLLDEQRLSLDDGYVPACALVGSHADLLEAHASLEEFFSRLESWCLQIMQKIMQKKQNNELSVIVAQLCERILNYTATVLPEWKVVGVEQPPVFLVTRTAALARLLKNGLDIWLGAGKEELVNYFTDWCNFSQGELEAAIAGMSGLVYDHLDIAASLNQIQRFTGTIAQLFHQLARLEYIGKRKEAGIFVKEEALTSGGGGMAPVATRRRSFLAD
jgi:hypothetical protein